MTTVEQSPLPFQDDWLMFQENAKSFKETERLMKGRDTEIALRCQETDRIVKTCPKTWATWAVG